MYRVMIVDDEPIVQKAITHVVKSSCPLLQVVAQTESGLEAVTLALQEKPDIIMMDIELVGLNGLEATNEIKKSLPETVIIIISAYDSFQYAKQSITLGVIDYLLKPVSRDDLLEVLEKAVNHLEAQRRKARVQLELKDKLNKMRPFLEEDFFFALLYPGVGMHPWQEYPQLLEFHFKLGQAVEIYVPNYQTFNNNLSAFQQLVKSQINGAKLILFGPVIGRTTLLLLGYESLPAVSRKNWEQLSLLAENTLGFSLTIILGEIYEEFVGMIRSFQELRQVTQCYHYETGVYSVQELTASEATAMAIPWEIEREFFEAVRLGQGELAKLVWGEIFQLVKQATRDDWQSVRDYFSGILAVLRRIFFENVAEEARKFWNHQVLQQINQSNNELELRTVFYNLILELTDLIVAGVFPEKNPEIKAAVTFMEKNYTEDLTLGEIAAAVTLSPSYLSKLFKEYRNQTVMDFLERIRIEAALNLIKETNLSIKEITFRVGYRDPNYFSKVFKKVTNLSPTEIRNLS